ncbi:MAG: hypothetical protein AB7T49_03090 [Oligoflexales bacterium]
MIYFIDSDKTRSFKLPLKIAYTFVAFALFLALWLFTSLTLLYVDQRTIGSDKTHIQNLLGVIFQYQTRYDEIFEIAYEGLSSPAATSTSVAETGKPKPAAPQAREKPAETKEPVKTVAEKPATEAPRTVAETSQPETEEEAQPEKEAFAVQVENMKEQVIQDELKVSFAIRNTDSTQKASGFIWGVAKIEKEDGQTAFLTSPTSVNVDEKGDVKNVSQAYKFSIKFYKGKTLTFALPPVNGVVKEISVFVSDNDGQEKKGETLPVNIAFTDVPSQPAETSPATPTDTEETNNLPPDEQKGLNTQSEPSYEQE